MSNQVNLFDSNRRIYPKMNFFSLQNQPHPNLSTPFFLPKNIAKSINQQHRTNQTPRVYIDLKSYFDQYKPSGLTLSLIRVKSLQLYFCNQLFNSFTIFSPSSSFYPPTIPHSHKALLTRFILIFFTTYH